MSDFLLLSSSSCSQQLSVAPPLPIGFRFSPTKEEVLLYYLRPAVNGDPLPYDILMKGDIYGDNKEPWNLFDKHYPHSFWVLTRLKRKSKSKIDRIAGCGCWLNRNTNEVFDSGGKLIGVDKYFTFTCKKAGSNSSRGGSNGSWIMHEYSLSDKGLEDFVICQIRNTDAEIIRNEDIAEQLRAGNKKKRKAPAAATHDVDVMAVTVTKREDVDHQDQELNESSTYSSCCSPQGNTLALGHDDSACTLDSVDPYPAFVLVDPHHDDDDSWLRLIDWNIDGRIGIDFWNLEGVILGY